MGIEQAFSDQTLLDVVSLLSARNESGRLKFAGGTMRGAFFFSKGKLVDAHLGPFTGFQAVNLAISVGKARLSFDPSIESHSSSFKVPAERLILKERFGIETAALETTKPETPKTEVPGSVEKILTTSPMRTVPHPLPQQVETKTKVPVQETEIEKVAYGSRDEIFLRGIVNNWSSRRNRLLLMCLIFLVVIPTTVGLASYWSNAPESTVRSFSAAKAPETLPGPVAVPAPSQPDENLTKTLPADEPIPLRPQPSVVTAELRPQDPETNRLNPVPVKDNEVAKVTLDPPAAPPEPSAKTLSRTITVVVEIEEGRVTEAFIQQPQQGLAAYEATALRLARQRRFPKGTTRRETITLPVTREQ
jgi:hypothetical protein